MDERSLFEKLRRIEALFAGATTDGERDAAGRAAERIKARLGEVRERDPAVEFQFSMHNPWSKMLFTALLRRYGIKPYRYRRQRRTTVMAKVPKSFLDETLWPEFLELDKTLTAYLNDITQRVIREGVHGDAGEAEVRQDQPSLE